MQDSELQYQWMSMMFSKRTEKVPPEPEPDLFPSRRPESKVTDAAGIAAIIESTKRPAQDRRSYLSPS